MSGYIGDNVVVEFGTLDISGHYTGFDFGEEAPEANRIDVSDKSSSAIETEEALPGEPKSTCSVTVNDELSGASAALSLTINQQDTLICYPEGKTHGKPMRTLLNARLGTRRLTGGYQSKMEWTLNFYSYETVTDSTYSTI
jgi:hypothetical protein